MLKSLPKYLLLFLIACCVKNVAHAQAVADSLDAKQTTVYTNIERDFYKKIGDFWRPPMFPALMILLTRNEL